MLRLWILAVLGLIAVIGFACRDSGNDLPQTAATATLTASGTSMSTTAAPSTTASASSATPTSTATLTYNDSTNGYSFEYPASWYLSPAKDNGGNPTLYSYDPATAIGDGRLVPSDKLKVFFWVAEGVDKPLAQWLADGDNTANQVSPLTVISQSDATLDGRQGTARVTESDGVRTTSYYIPISNKRVFVVNAGPSDSKVWPQFEPVLASLLFAS
ncbi:MAG TPA: hypothetical protein VIP09_07880 [Dehalococcoidia bacterium]|jgi:hypothetical protein